MSLPRGVTALALGWCLAFVVLALGTRVHLFADGSLFAYGVAAGDAWAFHWRNIPTRVAAYLYAPLPGQIWGALTADPAAGVAVYAGLLAAAPALGLGATWLADRSGVIRLWAALSVVLFCPMLFGFPTEMWVGMAAFWPAMALAWTPGGAGRAALAALAMMITALSHEAGLLWVAGLALLLLPFSPAGWRAGLLALPGVAGWAAMKLLVTPDPYVAGVMARVALTFTDPSNLLTTLSVTLAAALALFGAALALRRGPWVALGVAALALAIWWLILDHTLHAWARYFLRTLVFLALPLLALLAALHARGRLPRPPCLTGIAMPALLLVSLVHGVETAKFIAAWRAHLAAVQDLVMGAAADPALGDAAFVSTARLPAASAPLAWHSTAPFLGALAAPGYAPARLLVDPGAGYFWFDCAAATLNAGAARPLPQPTRDMLRRYTCLHR